MRLAAAGVYNGMAFHRVAPGLRHPDRRAVEPHRAAHREAAGAGPQPAAGVQRHEAREGDRLDGARRRARQRDDVVLHLHRDRRRRSTASTRRSAASWTGWRRSRRSRRRPRTGETPNTRIESAGRVRIERSGQARADAGLTSGDEPRDADRDADEVLDLNAVARLEVVADHRLRADARHVDLAVRIFDVGEVDVPRHLAVNAHRLDLLQNAVARSFKHSCGVRLRRTAAPNTVSA